MIDPEKINDEFRAYYASLYTSETNVEKCDFDGFLSHLEIPITAQELSDALKANLANAQCQTAFL